MDLGVVLIVLLRIGQRRVEEDSLGILEGQAKRREIEECLRSI